MVSIGCNTAVEMLDRPLDKNSFDTAVSIFHVVRLFRLIFIQCCIGRLNQYEQ